MDCMRSITQSSTHVVEDCRDTALQILPEFRYISLTFQNDRILLTRAPRRDNDLATAAAAIGFDSFPPGPTFATAPTPATAPAAGGGAAAAAAAARSQSQVEAAFVHYDHFGSVAVKSN